MDEKRVRYGRLFPGSRAFEAVGMAFYVARGVAHHYSIGIKVVPAVSIPDPAAAYQGARQRAHTAIDFPCAASQCFDSCWPCLPRHMPPAAGQPKLYRRVPGTDIILRKW